MNLNLLIRLIMTRIQEIPSINRTKEEVQKQIDTFLSFSTSIFEGSKPLSDEEKEYIKEKVFSNVYLVLEEGIALTKKNTNFTPWLSNERSSIDFYYWNRYKTYLISKKGWAEGIVSTLDKDSDKILDLLGNPKDTSSWLRRGLIIGDIQSGKTANYTSLMNKAADAGYQVILLFTGTTENLRMQTQSRIDMEFIGMPSGIANNTEFDSHWAPIGVGEIDGQPKKQPISFTSVLNDFRTAGANQVTQQLQENGTYVFVIKKNKRILDTLSDWLAKNNPKKDGAYDLSALIIDDEADNASINTNKPDANPTTINKGIRKILSNFARASYLAVTATPYANIFIDGENLDADENVDLFPSDYIYLLSTSNEYVGASALFSEDIDPQKQNCIERIDSEEMEEKLPLKHKKDSLSINSVEDLPETLMESVRYYLLAQGLLDYKLGMSPHRSMLINVSRFTIVQNNIKNALDRWLRNDVWDSIKNNHMMPDWANSQNTKEFYELKQIWDKYHLEDVYKIPWKTYSKNKLWESISKVEIISVNQSNESSRLNYENYKDGYRVIAVGGFSLSRGLTLEGLVVSFFYRNSKAYDTLMQMGRWFGYRSDYIELFKIWMSEDSISWYETIVEATENLKLQIETMNKAGRSPSDFGLAVQRQPLSRLLITARNKMIHTEEGQKLPVMISGNLIETPRLEYDLETNRKNGILIKEFVKEIYDQSKLSSSEIYTGSSILLTDIPKENIASLVKQFQSDKWNLDYQSEGLFEYIKNDVEFSSWDVAIVSTKSAEFGIEKYETNVGIIKINRQSRSVSVDAANNIFKIGKKSVRVGSGGITKIGLPIKQIESIQKDNEAKGNITYDANYLSVERKPLLLLYSVKIVKEKNKHKKERNIENDPLFQDQTIYAIGLGFPNSTRETPTKYVQYIYNPIAVQLYLGFEENLWEDEDEE